jgi:hypothetical protein
LELNPSFGQVAHHQDILMHSGVARYCIASASDKEASAS